MSIIQGESFAHKNCEISSQIAPENLFYSKKTKKSLGEIIDTGSATR